ncbi:Transcription factor spt8 [Sporothrix curviconia]|uniref:Transcription factor spt8 n=1 Tax=Sporothrix curviconia TaxID=1260050 RepID=A0ABP0C3W8_9PEZI
MDEDDRDSNAFSENDQDEVMGGIDEPEPELEPEPENEPEEDEEEADEADGAEPDLSTRLRPGGEVTGGVNQGAGPGGASRSSLGPADSNGGSGAGRETARLANAAADGTAVDSAETMAATTSAASRGNSGSPRTASFTPSSTSRLRLRARPEALSAKIYDIVPTMAAPQATSINALAVTPDLRYWMTGGSDGYIRKYDGPGTINGRQLLTVAQRHPFVDSVVKAGILMSYWENEEPPSASARGAEEHILSPVYSLAVHSRALWLLAGTESGGINLQSVRHDEGKRITCLQRHANAVSVLQLAPDEKSVLSGSWDKAIFDWDLNTGQTRRHFDGYSGQISAIELRPASGAPIPAQGSEEEPLRDVDGTLTSSDAKPVPNGVPVSGLAAGPGNAIGADASASGASATINGDDPLPDHESLFGSPGGSLFGGSDAMGAIPFEDDDMGMASGSGAIGEGVGFAQDVDMVLDTGDAAMNLQADDNGASSNTQAKSDSLATPLGAHTGHTSSLPEEANTMEKDSTTNIASPLSQQQQQQRLDQELQQSAETQLLGAEEVQASSSQVKTEAKGDAAVELPDATDDQEKNVPAAIVYSSQEGPPQFDPTQH